MFDLRDFSCPVCYRALPHYPTHGDNGAYCSTDCRDEAEPDFQRDEDETGL